MKTWYFNLNISINTPFVTSEQFIDLFTTLYYKRGVFAYKNVRSYSNPLFMALRTSQYDAMYIDPPRLYTETTRSIQYLLPTLILRHGWRKLIQKNTFPLLSFFWPVFYFEYAIKVIRFTLIYKSIKLN